MTDRTEGTGLAGLLTVVMDGQPYQLRVLTIERTEAWQRQAAAQVAGMDVPDEASATDLLTILMRAGTDAAIAALAAYDEAGVLGGADGIRARMNPMELRAAMEVVMAAAVPFDLDASRSVAAVFGGPTRTLAATLALTIAQTLMGRPVPASSMPGPSPDGASATTTSDEPGPPSSSSSAGSTATTSSDATPSSDAMPSPTA